MIDVLVVGAGPAGLRAAAECAIKGLNTLVVERKKSVGDKPCGAALTPSVTREYRIKCEGEKLHTLTLQAGDNKTRLNLDQPVVSVYKKELDKYLLDKALDVGARVEFNKTYKANMKSRVLVNASGASNLPRERLALTAQVYIEGAKGDFKFLYDKRLSSYGYGWVIPKKKGLVAGVGCLLSQMNHPSQIRKNLAWMLGREAIEALEYPRIGLVPFMGPINKTCAGTMLKVGDAAGFASPFSGEGLYYGLKSASIASDVISDYLEFGTSLNEYERAWRESFGQILLLNRLAAKVLYGNRFMLKYLIKKIEGNQKITSLLNKHMSKQEITPINYVQSIPHILGV